MTIMSVLLSPGKNEHVKLRARDKSIFGKLRDEMTGVKRELSFKLPQRKEENMSCNFGCAFPPLP